MKFLATYSALVERFNSGNFGIDTKWPNKGTNPQGDKPWAKVDYLPGDVNPSSVGPDGFDLHEGIFQVTLFYPANKGFGDMLEKADAMSSHFRAGSPRAVHAGQDVILRGVRVSPPRTEGNSVTCAVSIYFAAYVRRV